MAHWHDYNPWANTLAYITWEDFKSVYIGGTDSNGLSTADKLMLSHGPKIDAYVLPSGSVGIRFGVEGADYLSPSVNEEKARGLWKKYSHAA